MSIWKTDLGSPVGWRTVVIVVLFIGTVWPTLNVAYWHSIHGESVQCSDLSISLPLLWTATISAHSSSCPNIFSLTKSAPTIFGSSDAGSILTILGKSPRPAKGNAASLLKKAFNEQYLDVKAYTFSTTINHCLIGHPRTVNIPSESVICDFPDGSVLLFTGSESALDQVRSMIR